ncbi:MFS transporter [Amycolatopsis sp. NPDC051128]|uniref:MFS transporter n=1 Tax=Amycolatopsis sp. NPDC051128 TaxID=3155412 RepID=UPI0034355768
MTTGTANHAASAQTGERTRLTLIMTGFLLCVFAVSTAELLVAGLLPQLAVAFGVSTAGAGGAVTAYALGVVIGGPLVTVATARLPRKGLTLGLVGLFAAGTVLCATTSAFGLLLTGRVIAAMAQATLFALSLVTVTSLVPPERAGRAIATVVSGFTVATVLGVPLGALTGQQFGWRAPFFALAGVALAGGALLAAVMPKRPAGGSTLAAELKLLSSKQIVIAIATTVVGLAGVGTVFTYIAPLLMEVTGFGATTVSVLLLVYGAGSVLGNLLAGRCADLAPAATLRIVFGCLVVVLGTMPWSARSAAGAVASVLALGLLCTATIAPLQRIILRHAGEAPMLSVTVNVSGFNLAGAIGAMLGGGMVAAGKLPWLGLAGAVLAAGGLGLSFVVIRRTPD